MCEVDSDRRPERSTGVSVRLSKICLWRFSLDGGDLFSSVWFLGEGLRQVVLIGKLVCSFVVKVWFELVRVGL